MLKARRIGQARRAGRRGFTLIELMIVVAIIGILAVLAVFGVRKYLANAKTAEARNNIGEINRLAISAYEHENSTAELIGLGAVGAANIHQLCGTSAIVPAAVPVNKKYQPNPTPGNDFETGSTTVGWKCLKFEIMSPVNFSYSYVKGAAAGGAGGSHAPVPGGAAWVVEAQGDLNGDGVNSSFVTGGQVTAAANGAAAVPFSTISEVDPEE
jgi:type IV pilus assembly protein PilA